MEKIVKKHRKNKPANMIGIEEYDFDFFSEFRKYKRMRENNSGNNNYAHWKQGVKSKYDNYSKEKLESFLYYLNCEEQKLQAEKGFDKDLFDFTFGGFIGGISLKTILDETEPVLDAIGTITVVDVVKHVSLCMLIVILLMTCYFLVRHAVRKISKIYISKEYQRQFLAEYKKIIEKML